MPEGSEGSSVVAPPAIQQQSQTEPSPVSAPAGKVDIAAVDADVMAKVDKQAKAQSEPWLVNAVFVVIVHAVAVYAMVSYRPKPFVYWMTVASWFFATLGITVGYHRLWSHRAYKAHPVYRFVVAIMGTMGFQGSIKWWVLRHRLHHRYTDTEHDPYNALRGLWFSHMGWIFEKPYYPRMKLVEQSDLNADPIVVFQHKYFPYLAFLTGFILPTIIGYYFGDGWGAYLYCGFVARIAIWHVTFSINSFAHWSGDQLYSTEMSARGNLLLAILTNGEGYHNFHHEFPKDYRNGIEPFDWDPTKWVIWFASLVGLTWDLTVVPQEEIEKAKVQVMEQKLTAAKKDVNWGPEASSLPVLTQEEFRARAEASTASGGCLFIIDGLVIDATKFVPRHPGGEKLLRVYHGKDATKAFYGGLNNHTLSARTLLRMLPVARIASAAEKKDN